MANLVLAFAELAIGAVVIDAAIKGDSITNVVQGKATQNPVTGLGSGGGTTSSSSSSTTGTTATPTQNSNGYIDPLSKVTNWERTDQGVDATLPVGAPIVAPGKVKILGVEPNWYNGQPFLYYQLLDGPDAGKVQYIAEQITDLAPVGKVLNQGDTLATFAPSGTGIEMGWATKSGQTLAMATTGYTEGYATSAGKDFRTWLNSLGAGAGSGAGLSIGAGIDPDDLAAAVAHQAEAVKNAITTTGYVYPGS